MDRAEVDTQVLIVGGGIGGLTTALLFHERGIPCLILENASAFMPLGVGINIMPHASQVLGGLGLEGPLSERAVITGCAAFYNRFGQLIFRDPAGREAGYGDPQYSVHRGVLHEVLVDAVRKRLGDGAIKMGHRATGFMEDGDVLYCDVETADGPLRISGHALVAADGIHSVVRRQLFPEEAGYRYSGVMMWRGAVEWPVVLDGRTMIRAGWLATGKMVIYPIGPVNEETGRQLLNWAAEVEMPQRESNDWNRQGKKEDFAPCFEDWAFDWLDVPALIEATEPVLEYPMVDRDPLPRWTHGLVTLLGDAAHPMLPRGSNGAGQAILDAEALARHLGDNRDIRTALASYDRERVGKAADVVLTNRSTPPDSILREVYERTGDRPFARIEDVISVNELTGIQERYREVAGMTVTGLAAE